MHNMNKIVTFGELMLRLKSPFKERLLQSPSLEAVFGGSEANVAVSIANYGGNASFITSLPNNPIGVAAIKQMRQYGVEVNAARADARMGLYFLESGADMRPSRVIYDRADSAFSLTPPTAYDWKSIMEGATIFHVSGVTCAICQNTLDCAKSAIKAAKDAGAMVSVDLNYRKKLWNYGKTSIEVMTKIVHDCDILVANEGDIQSCLGITCGGNIDMSDIRTINSHYEELCNKVIKEFPNIKTLAITLRQSVSADYNRWSAVLLSKGNFYASPQYAIDNIIERVGAGDAFCGALLYALAFAFDNQDLEVLTYDDQAMLDFAVAASALKHTFTGDFNLATLSEVEALMKGNSTGRIER